MAGASAGTIALSVGASSEGCASGSSGGGAGAAAGRSTEFAGPSGSSARWAAAAKDAAPGSRGARASGSPAIKDANGSVAFVGAGRALAVPDGSMGGDAFESSFTAGAGDSNRAVTPTSGAASPTPGRSGAHVCPASTPSSFNRLLRLILATRGLLTSERTRLSLLDTMRTSRIVSAMHLRLADAQAICLAISDEIDAPPADGANGEEFPNGLTHAHELAGNPRDGGAATDDTIQREA